MTVNNKIGNQNRIRTTLLIDDDVMERARAAAAKSSTPFKTIVSEALRADCKVRHDKIEGICLHGVKNQLKRFRFY